MESRSELINKAKSWALNGEHLRVYPIPQKTTYKIKKVISGQKPKNITLNHVKICIEIGNAKHIGKEDYTQGDDLTNKVNEIYLHYYNQRKKQ